MPVQRIDVDVAGLVSKVQADTASKIAQSEQDDTQKAAEKRKAELAKDVKVRSQNLALEGKRETLADVIVKSDKAFQENVSKFTDGEYGPQARSLFHAHDNVLSTLTPQNKSLRDNFRQTFTAAFKKNPEQATEGTQTLKQLASTPATATAASKPQVFKATHQALMTTPKSSSGVLTAYKSGMLNEAKVPQSLGASFVTFAAKHPNTEKTLEIGQTGAMLAQKGTSGRGQTAYFNKATASVAKPDVFQRLQTGIGKLATQAFPTLKSSIVKSDFVAATARDPSVAPVLTDISQSRFKNLPKASQEVISGTIRQAPDVVPMAKAFRTALSSPEVQIPRTLRAMQRWAKATGRDVLSGQEPTVMNHQANAKEAKQSRQAPALRMADGKMSPQESKQALIAVNKEMTPDQLQQAQSKNMSLLVRQQNEIAKVFKQFNQDFKKIKRDAEKNLGNKDLKSRKFFKEDVHKLFSTLPSPKDLLPEVDISALDEKSQALLKSMTEEVESSLNSFREGYKYLSNITPRGGLQAKQQQTEIEGLERPQGKQAPFEGLKEALKQAGVKGMLQTTAAQLGSKKTGASVASLQGNKPQQMAVQKKGAKQPTANPFDPNDIRQRAMAKMATALGLSEEEIAALFGSPASAIAEDNAWMFENQTPKSSPNFGEVGTRLGKFNVPELLDKDLGGLARMPTQQRAQSSENYLGKEWLTLDPPVKRALQKFGITAQSWDALRQIPLIPFDDLESNHKRFLKTLRVNSESEWQSGGVLKLLMGMNA